MQASSLPLPRRPLPISARGLVLVGLLLAAVWSWWTLGLSPSDFVPHDGGLEITKRFFASAVSPATTHEGVEVIGRPGIFVEALEAIGKTILIAAAAMSIAIPMGLLFGLAATSAWVSPTGVRRTGPLATVMRALLRVIWAAARVWIACVRSIHELFWAFLFMATIGLSETAAVLALAIPYSGVLGKIYAEMVDEAPRDAAGALRAAGASHVQTFLFGLLPQALPDMIAYSVYRFECAIRSSAVLGFFGVATIGYYIHQSFQSGFYREVWTYLYLLIVVIVLFDAWSGAVRRRLTS